MASQFSVGDLGVLLFVGEGNFSFSAGVARALGDEGEAGKLEIIATDWIPDEGEGMIGEGIEGMKGSFEKETLRKNVKLLRDLGHKVFLDVDARKLEQHSGILEGLRGSGGDVGVIFNFPHAKSKKMKIDLNRELLREFFGSCDKLGHFLEEEGNKWRVTPVVSLCGGQSGIEEVDGELTRKWGDSWQINDMAASGHFVLVEVSKFQEWASKLVANLEADYRSSYYRLQTGVSFRTEKALTFVYEHGQHVDPERLRGLDQILRLTKDCQGDDNPVICEFKRKFEGISGEGVRWSEVKGYVDGDRVYNHLVEYPRIDLEGIRCYLGDQGLEVIVEEDNKVKVKTGKGEVVEVGWKEVDKVTLFVDQLFELKFKKAYRQLMIDSGKKISLFPKTHEFDISFWTKEEFCKDKFLGVLLNVYGLKLKGVEFVEEYVDDKLGRRSLCWRVQVEDLEGPLDRLTAHKIYLVLRRELENKLGVDVR